MEVVIIDVVEVQLEEGAHVTRVRTEQFDLLVKAVQAAEQDHEALCTVLRLERPEGVEPHWFFEHAVLPRLAALVVAADQHAEMQEQATAMVERGKARFGATVDPVSGRQVQKIGQRLPDSATGLIAPGMAGLSRRERRALERGKGRG